MPYILTDDEVELYVKCWGPEGGKPVVLIHGWPLNADSWDDIANALANAGFRAIAYDRRGFGRSDQPWDGYDYDTLAADLGAVLEEYADGQDAALVGFSMGGGEVVRYLANNSNEGVSHAVLIGSIIPYMLKTDDNPEGVERKVFDEMLEGLIDDRAGFLPTFAKGFYGVGMVSKPVSQGVLDWTHQMAMMAGLRPTLACVKAFSETDFRDDCARVNVPTLVIHGTSDATVPIDASSRRTVKLIPQAELVELDGEPHGVLATQKAEISDLLISFLTGENRQAIGGADEAYVEQRQLNATLNQSVQ